MADISAHILTIGKFATDYKPEEQPSLVHHAKHCPKLFAENTGAHMLPTAEKQTANRNPQNENHYPHR
jgi:hypothetical protein